jgi:hypothetical protein
MGTLLFLAEGDLHLEECFNEKRMNISDAHCAARFTLVAGKNLIANPISCAVSHIPDIFITICVFGVIALRSSQYNFILPYCSRFSMLVEMLAVRL